MSPAPTTAAPSNQPRAATNFFAQSLLISSPSLRQYTAVILHPSEGSNCLFLCHHFTEQAERCCQWYPELVSHLLSISPVGPSPRLGRRQSNFEIAGCAYRVELPGHHGSATCSFL